MESSMAQHTTTNSQNQLINNIPQPQHSMGTQQPFSQEQGQLMNEMSERDSAIVNDILKMNEENNSVQNQNNNAMYERQIDADANVMRQGLPPPTPEQIQEMNEINQQNQMNVNSEQESLQNQMNTNDLEFDKHMDESIMNELSNNNEMKNKPSMFDNMKDAIAVMVLIFIFMAFPINNLMVKIPMAIDPFGQPTMIGNLLKAVVASVLYFVFIQYLR